MQNLTCRVPTESGKAWKKNLVISQTGNIFLVSVSLEKENNVPDLIF